MLLNVVVIIIIIIIIITIITIIIVIIIGTAASNTALGGAVAWFLDSDTSRCNQETAATGRRSKEGHEQSKLVWSAKVGFDQRETRRHYETSMFF